MSTNSVTDRASCGINPRETGVRVLDLEAVFGNSSPVVLEIGSGKGGFLIRSAESDPDRNFLGVEVSLHYYRLIRRRIEKRGLANARIVNYDAAAFVAQMLAAKSIAEVHIYFPDPWPKKRHHKRRIIRPDVVRQLERVLGDESWGVYVTDYRDYFEAAVPILAERFETDAATVPEGDPRTNYEAKYREEGREIYQIRFRK